MLAVLIGGWLFLTLTAPRVLRLEELSVGTCLHVPTSANGDPAAADQVGSQAEVVRVAVDRGADTAPCDSSHSHEVAAVFTDAEPAGAALPGPTTLAQRHEAACEAALAAYVGHPIAGSAFELTVVVQDEAGWTSGRRVGACLVSRADGKYLTASARGSAR